MTIPILELNGDELIFNGEKVADISSTSDMFILKQFEYWLEFVTNEIQEENFVNEYDNSEW